jgi:carbon monoxide dehydrogenase subunit G
MRTAQVGALLVTITGAVGAQATPITLQDLPGSNGRWQEGIAIVNAPANQVESWLSDYAHWTQLFPDTEWSEVVGRTGDGRTKVRFRSRAVGREMTVAIRATPGLISYNGGGHNVNVQGKIFIQDLGDGRSRVLMQSTAEVHGALGAFASKGMKRDRARRKIRADLEALQKLASNSPHK